MNDRLSVVVTHADGATTRWGPDEWDAANIPQNISFGSSIPGGFRDLTLTLPRKVTREYRDLHLLDTITVIGQGQDVAWEGRIQQLPRNHAESAEIQVGAVGWGAHLKDDPTVQLIACDRRPDAWQEPPLDRRVAIIAGNVPYGVDYEVSTSAKSLKFDGQSRKEIEIGSVTEAWYFMPAGHTAGAGQYYGAEANVGNVAGPEWRLSDSEDGSSTTTHSQTLDNTLRSTAFNPAKRYVCLRAIASGTHTKAVGSATHRTYKKLAVYGDYDIPTVEDPDGADPDGFYASDLIAYIVGRWAPLLDQRDIETSQAWIPHFVIDSPMTAEDAIMRANGADLREWGVWQDRRFFYRAADPDRLCWEARLSEGAHLRLEGDVSDQLYNGVVVYYTEPGGTARTVGPISSGCDDEDATLQDSDPANPVNAHGISRRWATLNVSQVTTRATAAFLGATYLAEQAAPQRRGQLVVTGDIRHPTAGMRPAYAPRAGDWVRISDHPNDEPRRIIEASYSNSTATLTLDNSVHRLEALMEALGA